MNLHLVTTPQLDGGELKGLNLVLDSNSASQTGTLSLFSSP